MTLSSPSLLLQTVTADCREEKSKTIPKVSEEGRREERKDERRRRRRRGRKRRSEESSEEVQRDVRNRDTKNRVPK